MKNLNTKLLAGAVVLGLAGAIYSFSSGDDPKDPKAKKFEVIRMVNGEYQQFDTIIAATSEYTPDDYLNDLGFANDEKVSIIDFTSFDPQNMMSFHKMADGDCSHHKGSHKVIIETDEEIESSEEESSEDESHEVHIEKRVIRTEDGEEIDENIEVNVEAFIKELNIDSLIEVALEMEGKDSTHHVVMHKMILSDEEMEGDEHVKFKPHEMNMGDATYHKEFHGLDHRMEIAVWGDEHEDFTLLIVSEPDDLPTRGSERTERTERSDVKVFPNPATETAQLQLDFKNKATTVITITDVKGQVVSRFELGKTKGQFTHDIEVKGWESGVYFVHVTHGSEKIIEKLIVE